MLAGTIDDSAAVESPVPASVRGLGLLPTQVRFAAEKQLGTPAGAWRGQEVTAYEIHHGVATVVGAGETAAEPFLDGWNVGTTYGTTWHGAFENDGFRRGFLAEVARLTGVPWRPATDAPGFAARREIMLERLADAVEEHLDTEALARLIGVDL
jgi:adenosylcobyric acid synthase